MGPPESAVNVPLQLAPADDLRAAAVTVRLATPAKHPRQAVVPRHRPRAEAERLRVVRQRECSGAPQVRCLEQLSRVCGLQPYMQARVVEEDKAWA